LKTLRSVAIEPAVSVMTIVAKTKMIEESIPWAILMKIMYKFKKVLRNISPTSTLKYAIVCSLFKAIKENNFLTTKSLKIKIKMTRLAHIIKIDGFKKS
jgi:hypothetical protein